MDDSHDTPKDLFTGLYLSLMSDHGEAEAHHQATQLIDAEIPSPDSFMSNRSPYLQSDLSNDMSEMMASQVPFRASHSPSIAQGLVLPRPERHHTPTVQISEYDWLQDLSHLAQHQSPGSYESDSHVQSDPNQPETRRPGLPRRRSRYLRNHGSAGRPVAIPAPRASTHDLPPMQRWQESPPDSEPASLLAIADALQRASMREELGSNLRLRPSSSAASFRSSTSCSTRSVASSRSSRSNHFSGSVLPSKKRVTKARRKPRDQTGRIFQCTFCCDTFRTKHDWTRHETSLHLNLDQWVCAPLGGSVASPVTGRSHCAYCNMLDPTPQHLDDHHHDDCHRGQEPHIFRRKDHLVQHLRVFHHLKSVPIIDDWRIAPPVVISRCGFCGIQISSWGERVDHLAVHYRNGSTRDDWKGDHGFEASVAAQVRNALPPYLLAVEARSPIPFSATDPGTMDLISQIVQKHEVPQLPQLPDTPEQEVQTANGPEEEINRTTYASFLALHLGHFAQQNIAKGIFPTDQMFQDESRRLVYGDVDAWEHTMADNSEWLTSFRQRLLESQNLA